jgi:hypothetical protein
MYCPPDGVVVLCFRCGFAWIRSDLAILDPDPDIGNADPDPGARKLTKINK